MSDAVSRGRHGEAPGGVLIGVIVHRQRQFIDHSAASSRRAVRIGDIFDAAWGASFRVVDRAQHSLVALTLKSTALHTRVLNTWWQLEEQRR